ncbi:cytochrome P450 [Catenulispora sp. GP43]|uniref:cytochrome P450 n=1 Tax=Catenulispora sp. GP43 TaxID=3156263 RepID=UPI003518DE40
MTESEIWFQDPYTAFAEERRNAGPAFVPALGAWVVARHEDVLDVLRRAEEFSSANTLPRDDMLPPAVRAELADSIGGRPVVVNSDGAAHRRYRAPLLAGLTPARVEQVVPFIEERAETLVEGFAGDGRVEFVGGYSSALASETIGRLIGLAPEDVAKAVYGTTQALVMYFFPVGDEQKAQAARKFAEMRAMIDDQVRARRAEPRDDLCGALVAALAPDGGELTLDQRHEVASNVLNLFIAGFITATPLLGTMVLNLLRHREQWELLCTKPELIPAAVEEAVRYDTSMQSVRRITTAPVTLAGVEIPAGATLLVALASANRDAAVHERPDIFDITRPAGTAAGAAAARHLSFGHGPHACVGAQLFREEARATLRVLTERLPDLRLAPQEEGTMGRSAVPRDGSLQELNLIW